MLRKYLNLLSEIQHNLIHLRESFKIKIFNFVSFSADEIMNKRKNGIKLKKNKY